MRVVDMRRYLRLLEKGDRGAAEQRDLFAEHADRLAAEIERLQVRQRYLRSKADMWDGRARGDAAAQLDAVEEIRGILQEFD